jgi:hypothetical protein
LEGNKKKKTYLKLNKDKLKVKKKIHAGFALSFEASQFVKDEEEKKHSPF